MGRKHREAPSLIYPNVSDEDLEDPGGSSSKRLKMDAGSVKEDLRNVLTGILGGVMEMTPEKFAQIMTLIHDSKDVEIRWLAVQCVGSYLKISDTDKQLLLTRFAISDQVDLELGLQFQLEFERKVASKEEDQVELPELAKSLFTSSNGQSGAISVRKLKIHSESNKANYILIDSYLEVIKELCKELCSAKLAPLCIYGSTGTGKSTVIQLTASLFKRCKYPDIITVQMSDQIDSRLLLGSYHSTDLPGQFVWKAGCLTKAVLKGHWIVLEDLDSASPDVITLLDGLIDTGRLSVPGYGEIKKFHKDFRILCTCRTFGGAGDARLLDKIGRHWKKLKVDPLSPLELKILLVSLFPHLKTLAEKLSTIFLVMEEAKQGKGTKNRLLSLRDFLKLCRRIPVDLDFTKPASAVKIFQEAFDLFIASLYHPASRREVAEKLGAHLNILLANVEYFCGAYKPSVNIDLNGQRFTAGRYTLPMFATRQLPADGKFPVYSLTKRASCLLELICSSVQQGEPVLLLGETGVGKTSCVQFLAQTLSQKLIVVNLNRQSDSSDLLGGYKPVELKYIFGPLREEFETIFAMTFNKDSNRKFLDHVMTSFANKQWNVLVRLLLHVQRSAFMRHDKLQSHTNLLQRWINLGNKLSRVDTQLNQGQESPFAFSFIEGTLIEAIRHGYWILLDEINLATPEMLQCLSGVLESQGQIHLWEKGDEAPIKRHKNFHLFAAMNPSTDVGKKDLPLGLRNRFTEYFVDELTDADELQVLVSDYLRDVSLSSEQVQNLVKFYLTVRKKAETELVDGTGKKPHFSLRTLCRALKIASQNLYGSVSRSLYESFCVSFLTQLDYPSHPVVQGLIARHIFGSQNLKSILNQALPQPLAGNFVNVEGYWLPKGDLEEHSPENYILTPSIRRNLKDIARIVSAGKLPVLIQGETSVGKTSLIQYLATVTGNRCYRINNHQHTDLQEYVGSYQSDEKGKLVFTEGVLVQAMRRGEWVILDELNLAPSEVLEALNRLLDDNRQLFITETGVTVTAHPRFMLFATQNPPGLYGGRKLLSRAFRNRFVELHFDEIPSSELETILNLRCAIPPSYCKKIIASLKDLQMRRKSSAALQGKHGFATLRDLFRWAERYRLSEAQTTQFYDWDQHLADDGYLVLAGKVRKDSEAGVIRDVLKRHFKRTVDPHNLFSLHEKTSTTTRTILELLSSSRGSEFGHVVWTFEMRRLAVLIGNAIKFNEPVLLVGETGCGKTTVVQVLANLLKRNLYSINCHMHSEASDFLGGLRPIRSREEDDERLFEWVNGPLVEAMQHGGVFLADEISLADDSVLERINSVLETERTLLISEKGDETPQLITAHPQFQFIGTMNPGGDYGKKELSPALRNRLTEIWCPNTSEEDDLVAIIEHNLNLDLEGKGVGSIMIKFCKWLQSHALCSRIVISIRDYLAWVAFVNKTQDDKVLTVSNSIIQGACLTFLDGLGSGNTSVDNNEVWLKTKEDAIELLTSLTKSLANDFEPDLVHSTEVTDTETTFGIGVFKIPKTLSCISEAGISSFAIKAPTTCQNGLRLLRAMQLEKPILLEGSPGVGKTAIVTALAKYSNNPIVRINLSEQTDISDLFGADLPIEGETGGHFAWRDGPLLQALKSESWILLDELNLASQSVLEGLNACLDHRGEIYVPELNRTFDVVGKCSRIFACQNPVRQGGARKGLPKSFLNRFTQVFIDPLTISDLEFVLRASYPELPVNVVTVMTRFSEELSRQVGSRGLGARGAPWDFNLRDLLRWAQLVHEDGKGNGFYNADLHVDLLYGIRMRSQKDRQKVLELYAAVKGEVSGQPEELPVECGQCELILNEDKVSCGTGEVGRVHDHQANNEGRSFRFEQLVPRNDQTASMECLLKCLQMGWMPILVGPVGSGKSSLIKLVAQLAGRDLEIMTPSPEMDTIELLGGFEQADIYRRIDELTADLGQLLVEAMRWIVVNKEHLVGLNNESALLKEDFYEQWAGFVKMGHLTSQDGMGQDEELAEIEKRVDFLKTTYLKCKSFLQDSGLIAMRDERDRMRRRRRNSSSSSTTINEDCCQGGFSSQNPGTLPSKQPGKECNRFEEMTERVWRELQDIHAHLTAGIQTGGFHWIHSLLIKALQRGDWLLIDGANRCTSAVLDRLNSLLEPNGKLFLSERGTVEGEIEEIRPHPNFRLILAMNPSYGEISRAMRNRGVEIYLGGTELEEENDDRGGGGHGGGSLTSMATVEPTVLSLSVENFISSRWLRVWKEVGILANVTTPVLPVSIAGLEISPQALHTVSVYARALCRDLRALTMAVKQKMPWISSCAASHMDYVVALEMDVQYDPHFVSKYKECLDEAGRKIVVDIVRHSWALHRSLFPAKWEFKDRKTVGFLAEYSAKGNAVKELDGSVANLLVGFWEVWCSLTNVAGVLFGGREDGNEEWKSKDELNSLSELAELWLKGLKGLIWMQRLAGVAQLELNVRKNNENLMANLRLLLQWIGADVVPVLKKLSVGGGRAEYEKSLRGIEVAVRMLVVQEERTADPEIVHCEEILRERCFAVKPLRILPEFREAIPAFLMTVFDVWSCRSTIPVENWPRILDQLDVFVALHQDIVQKCVQIFTTGTLDNDNRDIVLKLAERFRRDTSEVQEEDNEKNKASRTMDVLKLSLFGLSEFLRLTNRGGGSGSSRASVLLRNPIQTALCSSVETKENVESLVKYLSWDERGRFMKAFVGGGLAVGNLSMACLLPYYTTRLLVDTASKSSSSSRTTTTYQTCTLGRKREMLGMLEQLGKTLHAEVFERKQRREASDTLDEMIDEFEKEVENICSELDGGRLLSNELGKVLEKVVLLPLEERVPEKMMGLGGVMVTVGGILMDVISQLPLVDPAVKKQVMARYLSEDLGFFKAWRAVQEEHDLARIGTTLPSHLVHPFVTAATNYVLVCEQSLTAVTQNTPDRPEEPLYGVILKDLKLFVGSFCSGKLKGLMEQMEKGFKTKNLNILEPLLVASQNWIEGHQNFVFKLVGQVCYWDVVAPALLVSSWISAGLALMTDALRQKHMRPDEEIIKSVEKLVAYPVASSLVPTATLDEELLVTKRERKKLLVSSLQTILNQVESRGSISSESLREFYQLSESFASAWRLQEEERQRKIEEEDAMYIYKGKERTLALSEEENDAKDIAEVFPSFLQEFQDLIEPKEFGDGAAAVKPVEEGPGDWDSIDSKDVAFFLRAQARMASFVSNRWIFSNAEKSEKQVDLVTPFMSRFAIGCSAYEKFAQLLGIDDEKQFSVGAHFALTQLRKIGQPGLSQLTDVYHEPCIDQVEKLPSVLFGLRKRVMELLLEWPEHPSLNKIIVVVERLESFPLDSPLMKFLTGLELLLETCQEWEQNAHAGVSIASSLMEMTHLIIEWRKLELSFWKNLVETTYQREQENASHWWFHISSATLELIRTLSSSGAEEEKKEKALGEFLLSLQQFMESSPLGQFESRLSMLYGIHCYVVALENYEVLLTSVPTTIHAVIWNTVKFYEEFRPVVRTRLNNLRAPIEKKMKDFVKICRWNDMNFSSLKDSVHKSQKQLSKLVKEFKQVLRIPVKTLMVVDEKVGSPLRKFDVPDRKVFTVVQAEHDDEVGVLVEQLFKSTLGQQHVTARVSKIYRKMNGITVDVLGSRSTHYAEQTGIVEGLVENVMTAVTDLQQTDVKETGEKRKQYLHHVHSRRRLALADLFKNLTKLNLSYRRGLLKMQGRDASSPMRHLGDFLVEPHDLAAAWKAIKLAPFDKPDSFLIKLWSSGVESDFQKSAIRMVSLIKAFQSPNKQLSVAIIDRCKGFSSDLQAQVTREKCQIAHFSKFLYEARRLLQLRLHSVGGGRQDQLLSRVSALELEFLQWQLVCQTCEDESNKASLLATVGMVLATCNQIKSCLKADGLSAVCVENLRKLSNLAIDRKTLIGEALSESLATLGPYCSELEYEMNKSAKPVALQPADKNEVARDLSKLLESMMLTLQQLQEVKLCTDEDTFVDTFTTELGCFNVAKAVESLKKIQTVKAEELDEILSSFMPILQQYLLLGQFYLIQLVMLHRQNCQLLSVLCSLFSMLGQKGFNLPPDFEEEAAKEGEELDSKGGLGLGDGETTPDAQDVSDRIESEDQLEETLKPGESSEPGDENMDESEKGIEMPDDFEGKNQDKGKKPEADNESDDENKSDGEAEADKQMGEVDDPDAEKLDEQMWGGSSDEEEDEMEETGDKGGERQKDVEPELKAKEPELPEDEGPESKEKQKPQPELDEQGEPNDDQIDPYHGQEHQEEEPEEFDLPEEINLDDKEAKENEEEAGENPFDLDQEKPQEDFKDLDGEEKEGEEEKEKEVENEEKEIDKDDLSEDGDQAGVDVEPMEHEEPVIDQQNKGNQPEEPQEEQAQDEPAPEELPETSEEQTVTQQDEAKKDAQENTEASEELKEQVDENVKGNESKTTEVQVAVEEHEPDDKDETGTGQAESKSGTGHEGKMATKEEQQKAGGEEKNEKEASRKPGETDRKRTLASEDPTQSKRLKTVDNPEDESAEPDANPEDNNTPNQSAHLYQHISEGEKSDAVTMDDATMEQAEQQQKEPAPEAEKLPELDDSVEKDEDKNDEIQVVDSQKTDSKGKPTEQPKKVNEPEPIQDEVDDEQEPVQMEVEGVKVATYTVQRPTQSSIHTVNELFFNMATPRTKEFDDSIEDDQEVGVIAPSNLNADALAKWHELEGVTLPLAQELCEQLRLILEPTLAARLRGDYKTGKRLNMRKVIPYVASGFRKDKIWLRRTQPSKREYQILLALDDSASMSDNHSKQMAFSAVAVVAKALSLLESGQLSVVSFGEQVDIMHSFDDPFTDVSGAHLLESFKFAQRQTRIAQLMNFVTKSMEEQKNRQGSSSSSLQPDLAQLVLIISDGRNVSSEGKDVVAKAIRRARDENIFIVFVIVDNPANKDSILDIRYAEFDDKNNLKCFNYYMDHFPFPFYMILRDLQSLPSVLSDALRQWFELVTSNER